MDRIHVLLEEVEKITNNIKYIEDKQKLNDLYDDLSVLESKLSIELIDKIDSNIQALDRKYDDLFELVNMFDEIKYTLEKKIKNEMVNKLRENNRRKVKQWKKMINLIMIK